jgi:large exoprotein involved in heme utilization and adhesion
VAVPESSGKAGNVSVTAGSLSIVNQGEISSTSAGTGAGGSVAVMTPGPLLLDGMGTSGTQIAASAMGMLSGQGGSVMVDVATLTVQGGAQIASTTAGAGKGGTVQVTAHGPLSLSDPLSGIVALATNSASGDAGSVMVQAPQITIAGGAQIASTTKGTGVGGSVDVATPAALVLDGMGVGATQIAASAIGASSGPGGPVTVNAGSLTIQGGAQIASSTAGPGRGGDVGVMVAKDVSLSGAGPDGASGITTSAEQGSSGDAGQVVLKAGGAIALSGGAEVASSTAGAGKGGTVQVVAQGALTLRDPGSGIVALATASGNAGSVGVMAPEITIARGAEIASTTAGTGAGGSVDVVTPGALILNGFGDPHTQIAASATGPQSGPGGSVTVNTNTLTIGGRAQIASSTAGQGKGGDVSVTAASDIVLTDPGPQITALSTGSGNAGSVTVSAIRLLMNNGAAISTEAETSTANGGNITLKIRDFLYLVSSKITTSVKGETGNGGDIAIDPRFVVLNHSNIIANAIAGHGGNIAINAGVFIQSVDSIVDASSQRGISGTVEIGGPRVDVNGALVVLSSELRSAVAVLRNSCASQAAQPQSSLVEAGRGGLPQDPDTTLPSLYIAGRDVNLNSKAAGGTTEAKSALQTRVHLTMRCG